jgi:hypothetical protein
LALLNKFLIKGLATAPDSEYFEKSLLEFAASDRKNMGVLISNFSNFVQS